MFQCEVQVETAVAVEMADNADVLFDLGILYSSGRAGAVDLVSAHKWFNLAALRGRSDAVQLRREIAELMSDAEIATAQREARAWAARH
jgi:TPR repeat protein